MIFLAELWRLGILLGFKSKSEDFESKEYYRLLGLDDDNDTYSADDIESAFIRSVKRFEEKRASSRGVNDSDQSSLDAPGNEQVLTMTERVEVLAICNSYMILRKPITRRVYDRGGAEAVELLEKPSSVVQDAVGALGLPLLLFISLCVLLLVLSYVTIVFCKIVSVFSVGYGVQGGLGSDDINLWKLLIPIWFMDAFFLVNASLDLADTGAGPLCILLSPYLPMLDVTNEGFASGRKAKTLSLASTCVLVVAHLILCNKLAPPNVDTNSGWTAVLLPWAIFEMMKILSLAWEGNDRRIYSSQGDASRLYGWSASLPILQLAGGGSSYASLPTTIHSSSSLALSFGFAGTALGSITEEQEDAYRILKAERTFSDLFFMCEAQAEITSRLFRMMFIALLMLKLDRAMIGHWPWAYIFGPLWASILASYMHVDKLRRMSKGLIRGIKVDRTLSRAFQHTLFSSSLAGTVGMSLPDNAKGSLRRNSSGVPSKGNSSASVGSGGHSGDNVADESGLSNERKTGEGVVGANVGGTNDGDGGGGAEIGTSSTAKLASIPGQSLDQPSYLLLQRRMRLQQAAKLMASAMVSFLSSTLLLVGLVLLVLYLGEDRTSTAGHGESDVAWVAWRVAVGSAGGVIVAGMYWYCCNPASRFDPTHTSASDAVSQSRNSAVGSSTGGSDGAGVGAGARAGAGAGAGNRGTGSAAARAGLLHTDPRIFTDAVTSPLKQQQPAYQSYQSVSIAENKAEAVEE